jgi:hypothetical protein
VKEIELMSKVCAIAFVALLAVAGGAHADTLDMQGTEYAARFEGGNKPSRGMTQARVEANYGTPVTRRGAVGDPPISRWDYADFVVYFEYDKVIHAVAKR